jgi:hypothetical protein
MNTHGESIFNSLKKVFSTCTIEVLRDTKQFDIILLKASDVKSQFGNDFYYQKFGKKKNLSENINMNKLWYSIKRIEVNHTDKNIKIPLKLLNNKLTFMETTSNINIYNYKDDYSNCKSLTCYDIDFYIPKIK